MPAPGRRRFTSDEVQEIINLRQTMTPPELSARFAVHPTTIHNLLTGKTYRSITHDGTRGAGCGCPGCRTKSTAEANLDRMYSARLRLTCIYCRGEARVSVDRCLKRRGEVVCGGCEGRR